ncbi:hypothetical protein LAZ67_2004235 [Cordylochernes scorpioides]|uniref:Uncharacterized protein n=1 Tax=Cordylochernes scorpioides TaxID=51811 RepID=A0ABY6K3R0_9ARAC|nr:hypothetical protein LAZ67_2004235 [Cordylochernes scorpioides]
METHQQQPGTVNHRRAGPISSTGRTEEVNIGYTRVEIRKKRLVDPEVGKPRRAASRQRPTLYQRSKPTSKVQECAMSRQKKAAWKVDQCVYLELCPDLSEAQYFMALEVKLGKGSVHQMTKIQRTGIMVDLVAKLRSLAPAVTESGGGYIERANHFLRRRLQHDPARSDYPSLSDLERRGTRTATPSPESS